MQFFRATLLLMFPNVDFVRFRPLEPDEATAAAAADEIASLYQRHPELELGELAAPAAHALGPARHMVRLLLKRAAAAHAPQDYGTALKVLQLVGAQTHFAQQPATAAAFADNEYLLFLFYKLAVYLQLVWFDGEYSDTGGAAALTATAPLDVNPELIYKKARVYVEKLRRVLAADGADTFAATECHYYHLICWLRLTEVFRCGHYPQYYCGFVELLEQPAVALAAPADVLWQCDALRCDAVYMFGVALALTLAFRDMAFLTGTLEEHTRNAVIDLCGELQMYRYLTLLLQTEFAAARQLATSADFQTEFGNHLGRLDRGGLHDFFVQTVTLKAFLLVMLHTRRILGAHLMALLAVSSVQPLLEAMSLLDLGQSGVGYSVDGAYFYNEGAGVTSARRLARHEIEQVRHRLEGDSVAECVRGALIERLLL